ncbi:MAG: hypothetical protein HC795_10355 [Coleofasciculaceae cyanobacterium RL_1_1]|nr:hypothetical protein [Coleofasciculaceae cyanobacterium RL_1_1]
MFLIPGAEVNYQSVLQLLVELQAVGGDRVSLAVGTTQEEPQKEPQKEPQTNQ